MKGFAAAWLLGMGIVSWRAVHKDGKPPVPGALMGVTGLFLALALIGDTVPSSERVVTAVAWGLDIAGLLNVLPKGLGGQVSKAEASSAKAQGETVPTGA